MSAKKLNEKIFAEYFTVLCEVFKTASTKLLLEVYYRALQELSDEEYKNAVSLIIKERVYKGLPLPAEILEKAKGNDSDRAIIAKDKLKLAMRTYGAYRTVIFDDPVLHKVIESIGGWVKANTMDIEDLEKYMKFEFEKVYRAYTKMKFGDIKLVFHGIHDIKNGIESTENAVYIGEKEKAVYWISEYEKRKGAELECSTEKRLQSYI